MQLWRGLKERHKNRDDTRGGTFQDSVPRSSICSSDFVDYSGIVLFMPRMASEVTKAKNREYPTSVQPMRAKLSFV